MIKQASATILATLLAIAALIVIAPRTGAPATALPPCAHEDGSGSQLPCRWNAAEQGNGLGTSHVVTVAP